MPLPRARELAGNFVSRADTDTDQAGLETSLAHIASFVYYWIYRLTILKPCLLLIGKREID